MIMPSRLRTFSLTIHVVSSVGWLGAVAAFLVIAFVGLTSDDPQTVRGAYLVMEPAAWYILVPLAMASLVTGVIQSLGTKWGLFRHYWVIFKLIINLISTAVLLVYTETFRQMADVAADPKVELDSVRNASPALHATLALVLLLTATALAIYKPKGMTRYGARKQGAARAATPSQ